MFFFKIKTKKQKAKTQSWTIGETPFGFGLVCLICFRWICVLLIHRRKGCFFFFFLQSVPIRVAGRTSEAWTLHASASHMQPPPKSRSSSSCLWIYHFLFLHSCCLWRHVWCVCARSCHRAFFFFYLCQKPWTIDTDYSVDRALIPLLAIYHHCRGTIPFSLQLMLMFFFIRGNANWTKLFWDVSRIGWCLNVVGWNVAS